jgi:hypothetical protein
LAIKAASAEIGYAEVISEEALAALAPPYVI